MPQRPLRLGTRRSLLARAQSQAIANALQRAHPGLQVELVGIDTRGDRISDVPLRELDGKAFFTAEIDAALREGRVDVTVHSYKDLSLDRPEGIHLAAVPARENPRDIAVFAQDVPERLAGGEPLQIGSSSPRRQSFVPGFLERALPRPSPGTAPRIEMCELRGNVDTRLRRVREARGSERALDGIVLAFAGLSRLAEDRQGAGAVLRELLSGLPRMLLPLSFCPAAPAQGALAIECRTDDARVRALLAVLDDPATRTAINAERALLDARGGGCHQQFGATQVPVEGLGELLFVREAGPQGALEPELRWPKPSPPHPSKPAWDGSEERAPETEEVPDIAAACAVRLAASSAAFIAHRRALPAMLSAREVNRCSHVWVSGTSSWFALAERGVWVEGCAESLGFATLRPVLSSTVLGLPALREWLVLTHAEAAEGWAELPVLATYRHRPGATADRSERSPAGAAQIWWHSGLQFERWRGQLPERCQHACGPGKTADHLRHAGVAPLRVFPSVRHWREWLRA
jgi:hydroxymethylbilane synthase